MKGHVLDVVIYSSVSQDYLERYFNHFRISTIIQKADHIIVRLIHKGD